MTCIVALKRNNKLYFGSDSCATYGNKEYTISTSKVFKRDNLIIGTSGDLEINNILRFKVEIPKQGSECDYEYIAKDLVESFKTICKKEKLDMEDSRIIIGYKGNIYQIQSDYTTICQGEDYTSIGSGESFALGALEALKNRIDNPNDLINEVLLISSKLGIGIKPPFNIITQE